MSNTVQTTYAIDALEADALREQVAALTAERDTLQLRVTGLEAQMATVRNSWVHKSVAEATAELNHLRDVLNRVYAERDNARDDAAALRNRYRAARRILARRRAEYTYRGQFIEAQLQQTAPAPVAATCPACGGTEVVIRYRDVKMDSWCIVGIDPETVPCPECQQTCDLCDGTGGYTTSVCGEWEERDCPACDGLGARRETKLYQERQARRAAALEAAHNAPIPF